MVKNALKMSKWFSVLLVLSSITISSCNHLTIVQRIEYDIEVPAPCTIETTVGSNLSLTCLLEPSDTLIDRELIWGHRNKELRFKNETDLLTLAKERSIHIYELLNDLDINQFTNKRTKNFTPVKISDRGAYFCGSLKYMLFKIIHIKVKEQEDYRIQSRNSVQICNNLEFSCAGNRGCINLHYKCDGKSDCYDGSDENWNTCNGDPREGKIKCRDGRYIPTSMCCDKDTEANCTIRIRPSCCPPLSDRYHLTILQRNKFGIEVPAPATIDTTEGANLSITCKLDPWIGPNDRELVWGRRTKELRFKNETDLLTLAKEQSTHIYELLKHVDINQSSSKRTKSFTPVKISDRGAYFCGSLKYMLFKIINIRVKQVDDTDDEIQWSNSLPTCNKDKFRCASSGTCINLHYKCDGKSDCYDSSDESWHTCNGNPCQGKIQCRDGRCIPTTWCCDKRTEVNCTVTIRPACCPPLPDPFDPIHFYNQNNEKDVAKSSGPRYLFITICVVSALLSFVLFLFIISKVCGFDTKPNRSRNNNSRNQTSTTFSNSRRCEHSECAIRREFNPGSTCLYRDNNNEVADPLIIFNDLASRGNSPIELSDHPPPYAEVVAAAPTIDKLTLDDLFNAPPPPYSSTKSFLETEIGNGNNVSASDFVNNTTSNNYCNNQSSPCDIGNTGDSNS